MSSAFSGASISPQGGFVDPIELSQNPESGISFGFESITNVYVPKASRLVADETDVMLFSSTPTTNGPVPSSSTLILSSTEPSKPDTPSALFPPISIHPAFDTELISNQPSDSNFKHAESTSNSVPVVVDPLAPRPPRWSSPPPPSPPRWTSSPPPPVSPSLAPSSHMTPRSTPPSPPLAPSLWWWWSPPPSPVDPLLAPSSHPTLWSRPSLSRQSSSSSSPSPSPSPFDLDSDAPDLSFSPPPPSDTNPNAPASAEKTLRYDISVEPFSRSSPLCLDGQIFDQSKYVVASGGYADIWTGSLGNKTVAIKVMRLFSGSGAHIETSRMFKRSWREYIAWSRLSHPNILGCLGFSYDFSPQTGQPSLISPWMSNGAAVNYIKEQPNVDRVKIVVDIARGLAYLHNMNPTIVHGDLRAGNVLISDKGTACLSDFGLSKILSDVRGMTTSSELVGSLRWMAPELLHGSDRTVQSDIWAYGMTVLEILTGKRPYSEETEISAVFKIDEGELPVRPNDAPLITDDVWLLCQKCWQFLPENRPSINDVLAEIEGLR